MTVSVPILGSRSRVSVSGSVDRRIREISARQRGRSARRQLRAAGIGAGAITRRIAAGDLVPRGNGVYALTPIAQGPWIAESEALLAVRPVAALSHLTGLVLWDMLTAAAAPEVHVTVVGGPSARRAGVRVHHRDALDPRDLRFRHGLPVTAPSLSLIQSAATLGPAGIETAFDAGAGLGLITLDELEAALAAAGPRTGVPLMRAVLADDRRWSDSRSVAERLLQSRVRQAGLPSALTNVRRQGLEVDCLWLPHRVVVEVDGFAYHGDRLAFERDRRRDQILTAAGFTVVRVTWRQLTREPIAVMVRLGQILAAAQAAVDQACDGPSAQSPTRNRPPL